MAKGRMARCLGYILHVSSADQEAARSDLASQPFGSIRDTTVNDRAIIQH